MLSAANEIYSRVAGAVCQKQRGKHAGPPGIPTPTREGSDKAKSIIIQASRQGECASLAEYIMAAAINTGLVQQVSPLRVPRDICFDNRTLTANIATSTDRKLVPVCPLVNTDPMEKIYFLTCKSALLLITQIISLLSSYFVEYTCHE